MIDVINLGKKTNTKTDKNLQTFSGQAVALSDLYSNLMDKYSVQTGKTVEKQTRNSILGGLITGVGNVIYNGAGTILGGLFNYFTSKNASKSSAQSAQTSSDANNALYAAQNMASYAENLYNRDVLLEKSMNDINNSLSAMSTVYGQKFVSMVYNYYLAQNGITEDTYSLMSGNFRTMDNVGYGSNAGTSTFNAGTDAEFQLSNLATGIGDNDDLFRNIYSNISDVDAIKNQLIATLFQSDTATALQLRNYEQQLRDMLTVSDLEGANAIAESGEKLADMALANREQNISDEQNIAEEEARIATSGLRGGTIDGNKELAQLQKDLNTLNQNAKDAILIRTLQYAMQKLNNQVASDAFTYKQTIRIKEQQAIESAITETNKLGAEASEFETNANSYITQANQYASELKDYFGIAEAEINAKESKAIEEAISSGNVSKVKEYTDSARDSLNDVNSAIARMSGASDVSGEAQNIANRDYSNYKLTGNMLNDMAYAANSTDASVVSVGTITSKAGEVFEGYQIKDKFGNVTTIYQSAENDFVSVTTVDGVTYSKFTTTGGKLADGITNGVGAGSFGKTNDNDAEALINSLGKKDLTQEVISDAVVIGSSVLGVPILGAAVALARKTAAKVIGNTKDKSFKNLKEAAASREAEAQKVKSSLEAERAAAIARAERSYASSGGNDRAASYMDEKYSSGEYTKDSAGRAVYSSSSDTPRARPGSLYRD